MLLGKDSRLGHVSALVNLTSYQPANCRSTQTDLMSSQHPHVYSHSDNPHLPSLPEKLFHPTLLLPSSAPSPNAYPTMTPYPAASPSEAAPLLAKSEAVARTSWAAVGRAAAKFVYGFMNPPMWGGVAALVGGLVPFLRHWLFDDEGWLSPLTESLVS